MRQFRDPAEGPRRDFTAALLFRSDRICPSTLQREAIIDNAISIAQLAADRTR